MSWADKNAYRIFVGKSFRKRPMGDQEGRGRIKLRKDSWIEFVRMGGG
jgi:hypothetical protein